jgi:thymidylate synthase
MRIYVNPVEMIKEVERDLFEMGITYNSATVQDKVVEGKEAETLEVHGYSYSLVDWNHDQLKEMVKYNKNNYTWALNEFYERVSGISNPGLAWRRHAEAFWKPYLRDGLFSYFYPERYATQLPYIIKELQLRPNTRQAIMTVYDQHQDLGNLGGRDRVPCSISYQFMIRKDELNCIYYQRSCDFIKFFSTDVFITIKLMEYIAAQLKVSGPGHFIHFLGSLHAFKKDLEERGIF